MRDLVFNDVFAFSRILKKANIKKDLDVKGKTTQAEMGAEMIVTFLENIDLAKNEINDFMGSLTGMTGKEFSHLPNTEALAYFEEFKNQPGINDFFKSASRLTSGK